MLKDVEIEELNVEISQCKKCSLCKTRLNTVPGQGNVNADIMVVAEAPGKNEDEKGIPLCGRSGKLYNSWLLKELRLNRSDVFTCNILKCRPPGNRDPLPEEISLCLPFLEKQIIIIQPKVIITLGRISAQTLLNDIGLKITQQHGKWGRYKDIDVMPVYHPSFLLRGMTSEKKAAVKSDFKKVAEKLEIVI